MKKYLLYIVCFICLTSCGDFLDEYSQDLVVVKTVEDLDEVLLGDVYLPNKAPTAFLSSSFVSWLNFLDDDITLFIVGVEISGYPPNGCTVIRIGCKRSVPLLTEVLRSLVMVVLG